MPDATETLMEFPCEVAIKVMGRNSGDFRRVMIDAIETEIGPVAAERVAERPSREGHFISLTVTVYVESHDLLRRIYAAMHATGLVLYAL